MSDMRFTKSPIDRFTRAALHYYQALGRTWPEPEMYMLAEPKRLKHIAAWKLVMDKREGEWRRSVGLEPLPLT
jgi:hypothetical protein